jgi:hypothetical protein
MVPFLSSCLNSTSDDTTQSSFGFARVVSYLGSYWLVADSGEKLIPTAASLATITSNGTDLSKIDRAYIGYTLVDKNEITKQASLPVASRQYNIVLNYIANISHGVVSVVKGTANDTIKSDPIVNLALMTSDNELLLTNGYLTIANSYYFSKPSLHYFTLVNYENEGLTPAKNVADPDTLNLYLSHNKNSDGTNYLSTSSSIVSSYPFLYLMSFNINGILNEVYTEKSAFIIKLNTTENSGGSVVYKDAYTIKYQK